jgi:WhiB family transcriptional regulator, redox-sensing transcriptional regulator
VGDGESDAGYWLELLEPPAWHRDAACRTAPPEVTWFPGPKEHCAEAMAICHGCTVKQQCLEWALAQDDLDGIWAGTTPRGRAKLKKARSAA